MVIGNNAEVTPEEIAFENKLKEMANDDWVEIKAMDEPGLFALEAQLQQYRAVNRVFGSDSNQLRYSAHEAIKQAKSEFTFARLVHAQGIQNKRAGLFKAATAIKEAIELIELIDYGDIAEIAGRPEPVPELNAASANDEELVAAINARVTENGAYPEKITQTAKAISLLKSKDNSKKCDKLTEIAEEWVARYEAILRNAEAAQAELAARKAQREQERAEAERFAEQMPDLVKQLEARVAELEGERQE